MSKILITENKEAINYAKESLTVALQPLQSFSEQLNKVCEGSPEHFDHEDLSKIINPRSIVGTNKGFVSIKQESPIEKVLKDIIYDKLTRDQNGSLYNGIKLNKEAAKNLIEYPDYSELLPIAEEIHSLFSSRQIDPEHFEISKNGKVNIAGDAYTKIEEMFREYAETPEQITRFKVAQKVAAGMKELADLNCLGVNGIESLRVKGIFWAYIDHAGKNVIDINPYWVRTGMTGI